MTRVSLILLAGFTQGEIEDLLLHHIPVALSAAFMNVRGAQARRNKFSDGKG